MQIQSELNFKPYPISNIQHLNSNSYLLSFQRDFDFHAGQILALKIADADTPRYYSIASGINDPQIDILFNVKPGSTFSPRLAGLVPGDLLQVSSPAGMFLGTAGPDIWIAAGTGIAPFRSMMRSGLSNGKILLQGASAPESLYFAEEFRAALGEAYVPCLSRHSQPGIFHGRVTDYLRQLDQIDTEKTHYLCGSAEMVVDTRDILTERGVPFGKVLAEVYF
ncbi:MAG TPA: FAD-binding oxidoreductase [Bacteroidales bacterium]|nr:FAD-binding oxidoreductase [Bacteroidales bacterium]HSA43708.1 FAD-binding oxidoreductase [Bacteroidales bacterium]